MEDALSEKKEEALSKPAASLEKAIRKLELFAKASSTHYDLQSLDIVNEELVVSSPIQRSKRKTLMECFRRALFNGEERERQENKRQRILQELLEAIDIVKSHYRMIDHCIDGGQEEREWAKGALETIHRCNAIIRKINEPKNSWKDRIVHFFSKKNGWDIDGDLKKAAISITKPTAVADVFSQGEVRERSKTLSDYHVSLHPASQFLREELKTAPDEEAPSQILDIFRMKAITLIGKHALPTTTIPEALLLVRETPIEVFRDQSKPSLFSLSQTVFPFPGETICCTGSFTQEHRENRFLPIVGSFRLTSKAMQTGYPHPSQTSWALADALILSHPLRPHKLPLFQALSKKKIDLAHALLPKGAYNRRAKQLLARRREIYQREKKHFISRHQQVTEAIIHASHSPSFSLNEKALIEDFYSSLYEHQYPFAVLTRVQEVIRESFIQQPFEKLSQEWLTFSGQKWMKGDPQQKAAYASQIFFEEREYAIRMLQNALYEEHEPKKKALIEYILFIGKRLGEASHPIVLQEMSEKMDFTPPLINDFGRKLLTVALQQVENFIEEMETAEEIPLHSYREMIEMQWERELALYTAPSFHRIEDPIALLTQEIEKYFRNRFFRKTALVNEETTTPHSALA